MKKLLIFSSVLLSLVSCNSKTSNYSDANIVVEQSNSERPNFVSLACNIPKTEYDSIKWLLPDGSKVSQLDRLTCYLPEKKTYQINLSIMKGDKTTELVKSVVISKNDPYLDNGEKLVWHDEFDGTVINPNWWTNETEIHVNDELQKYTNGNNVKLVNGKLIITAEKTGDSLLYGDYSSGRLNSMGKKEFQYGRVEFRAKMPVGKGTWPALWMLGHDINTIDWPACGEIDIMEHVGFAPEFIHSSLHTTSSWGQTQNTSKTSVPDCETEFHIYGMNWTAEKMDFYIDSPDRIFYTYAPETKNPENWPFNKPFFFIMNLAVGGHWGGKEGVDNSKFPLSMEVDYVRVYQQSVTK